LTADKAPETGGKFRCAAAVTPRVNALAV